MIIEEIYSAHDNTIDLVLKSDDVAQDLSEVTKITASFSDKLISSTDKASGSITWDQAGYDTGEIRVDAGAESITAGTYTVPIIIYDTTYTNGIVWGYITITVYDDVEATT